MSVESDPVVVVRRLVAAVAIVSAACAGAIAQVDRFGSGVVYPPVESARPVENAPGQPLFPQATGPGAGVIRSPFNVAPQRWRDGFQPYEGLVYPRYQGFPLFAPQSRGFGGYPAGPGLGGGRDELGDWRPPPLPDERRSPWPSWIQVEPTPDGRVASPTRALLARTADRVWFLSAGETAFVPLAFHDKFRPVEAGTALEVPNKGGFQVAFHDGGRLQSTGPVRLVVATMDAEIVEMTVERFSRLEVQSSQRPVRLALPDGSTIEVGESRAFLEGDDERGFILNQGPGKLAWDRPLGQITLAPGERGELLHYNSGRAPLGAELELEGGIRAVREGRVLSVQAEGSGGQVTWSGARIAVPPGAVLRIDALVGDGFPNQR